MVKGNDKDQEKIDGKPNEEKESYIVLKFPQDAERAWKAWDLPKDEELASKAWEKLEKELAEEAKKEEEDRPKKKPRIAEEILNDTDEFNKYLADLDEKYENLKIEADNLDLPQEEKDRIQESYESQIFEADRQRGGMPDSYELESNYEKTSNEVHLVKNAKAAAATVGKIKAEPFKIKSLKELTINEKINEHASVLLKGTMEPDEVEKHLSDTNSEKVIEITYIVNYETILVKSKKYLLFRGIVTEFQCQCENGIYNVEINALSHTFLLDLEKKTRTYKVKTYTDLFNDVAFSNNFTTSFSSDEDLRKFQIQYGEKFTMQYQETDWEFLKRMASRLNTVLTPDIKNEKNKKNIFCIGHNDSGSHLKAARYVYHGVQNLVDQDIYDKNKVPYDCKFEYIYTYQTLKLGEVFWSAEDKCYTVIREINSTIEDRLIINKLTLCSINGLAQIPIFNDQIVGASLSGVVTEVKQNKVIVNFHCDLFQGINEDYEFPYSTIYSSRNNIGFYCMPEVGNNVRVHFPSNREEDGIVISSLRQSTPHKSNPKIKSLQTADGKKIILAPEYIIIADDGMEIRLHETDGIEILTNKNNDIEFRGDEKVKFVATDIVGQATEKIDFFCGEKNRIEMKEKQIETNGSKIWFMP